MFSFIKHPRCLALVATLALVAASMSFGAGSARACCTTAIIDNLSNCNPTVYYSGGTNSRTLIAGSNLFFFDVCTDLDFYVINRCGTAVSFPPVGMCISVEVTATCCIRICHLATDPCQYRITTTVCPGC